MGVLIVIGEPALMIARARSDDHEVWSATVTVAEFTSVSFSIQAKGSNMVTWR